jgi:diacylglycerol kinase (ATP)
LSERAGLLASFVHAYDGLQHALSQRNMKVHFVSAVLVGLVGSGIPLGLAEKVTLIFCVLLIFFAEILNTALEAFVDLHVRDYHRLAMMAKDAAAAGVLVLAATTVVVLAEILWVEWDLVTANLEAVQRSVTFGVPLVIVEAIGLFAVRRGPFAVVRVVASLALLAPLVLATKDPIYAALTVGLVLVAGYARWSFPRLSGRGAPRTGHSGPQPIVQRS